MKRSLSGIMVILLITSMLALAFNIQPVEASGTIYIRAEGSVDPDTAPISSSDNITYTFTDDIYDEIVVERDNIVIYGAGYTLQGVGTTSSFGINLAKRNNVSIERVQVNGFGCGIYVDESSAIKILDNNITANSRDGIYVDDSSDVEISVNNVYSNDRTGIYVYHSSNNTISGNVVYSNSHRGISVGYCDNSTLFNNHMTGNTYNFCLFGDFASNHENSVDFTNVVDGKPIYYLRNITDTVYDGKSNGGIFYLVNCRNITIRSITLANNGVGIYLWNTTDSNIEDLIISNNSEGIRLRGGSRNNVVSRITIASNKYSGVHLRYCYNNVISNNTISNNNGGMFIYHSNSNIVSGNFISNNERGISLGARSRGNLFLHNNFINNTYHARTYFYSLPNFWNNTLSGNYWSDYSGADLNRDGIGDTPYVIAANNTDNFPLMYPWGSSIGRLYVLIRDIKSMGLRERVENRLVRILEKAVDFLEKDRKIPAINTMFRFVFRVWLYRWFGILPREQANHLTTEAKEIAQIIWSEITFRRAFPGQIKP